MEIKNQMQEKIETINAEKINNQAILIEKVQKKNNYYENKFYQIV
jgi:hypothetical protein